jgi:hypothetical protein
MSRQQKRCGRSNEKRRSVPLRLEIRESQFCESANLAWGVFAVLLVVVAVVPVALGAPAMFVFIPPAMPATPAGFARFMQLMASLGRLAAVATVILDGFMKTVIGLGDAPLTIVVIGAQAWGAGEEQESRKRGAGDGDFCHAK